MSARYAALAVFACLLASVAGTLFALSWVERANRVRRRAAARGSVTGDSGKEKGRGNTAGLGIRYAEKLTRRLYAGSSLALSASVRSGRMADTRAGIWYRSHAARAGCSKDVSTAGFCEARFRLGIYGCAMGALIGVLLSNELAVALGLIGALAGATAPKRAVRSACRKRTACAQRHLSEMLEVVALGLRSGLTFDRSFELYGSHFDNEFAQSCARAYRSWALGLVTREEALRELAASYDCDQLSRVVDSIVRSLRFGSALTGILEEAAAQSRADWRTALEERVAKAPVKMMLPTGTLILPAMLLMVMGPILLELASGF